MSRTSFFMYPVNNLDDPDSDDELFGAWSFNIHNYTNPVKNALSWIFNKLWSLLSCIYYAFGYYFMWIVLHYIAIYLYPEFCAPYTILGFILSPFMISAPHCIAMRWIITEGSNIIIGMWIMIGGVLVNKMLQRS